MIGPEEVVFNVVRDFTAGVKADTGCGLNFRKCKMYNINHGQCEAAERSGYITEELRHLEEGRLVDEDGRQC